MWNRISSIIVKEFIQIRRDRRTLAIALAMPVMQLFLFTFAINTTVDHVPAVVFDEARDATSRAFLQGFFNSGYFDRVGDVASAEAARQALDAGRAKVGFLIPPDFTTNLKAGRLATAQVVIDGSDPNVAQTALFSANVIAQALAADLAAHAAAGSPIRGGARSGGSGAALELRPVVLYNPGMQSVTFMVPGLIGLILQFQTVILTAFAVVRERERGTLEQLIVTPIRSWELMLGKLFPYVVIAFVAASAALALGYFVFGVAIEGSLGLLLALSIVFLLGSLGIGLLISTVSKTQTQAMQTALFFLMPSILLSGFVFARESMPALIFWLSYLIPLTYYLHILRGIILKGVALDVLWLDVLPLSLFGLAVFALSALRFTKKIE